MASSLSNSDISLLIVEDDKTARDILTRMVALKFKEFRILAADNGRVGLELFREHAPELVLTDISMPEMDGIEMARQIKSISPGARLIVLTAYGDKGFLERFTEIGFCEYLMKPVDFKVLFEIIERCCGKNCNPR